MKSKKIIYSDVSLSDFDLESATRVKNEFLPIASKLLGNLSLRDHVGRDVCVSVEADDLAYGKPIFTQARASKVGEAKYKIEMGVGLLGQLSLVAKTIGSDKCALRGRTKTKLIDPGVRDDGRAKALGDFAFYYMCAFVLWHEVAHIALGHLDWLADNSQLNAIEEFGQSDIPGPDLLNIQTMEGDADRQAALWAVATIDESLSSNPFLRYPIAADAFYDVGYIYGALFMFLDSIDQQVPQAFRKHPKSSVRLGVAIAFVEDYLKKYRNASCDVLMRNVYEGGLKALSTIFHSQKRPFDVLEVVRFMSLNGERISSIGIRSLQHHMSKSLTGSFRII